MTVQVSAARHLGYVTLSLLLVGAPLAEAARLGGHGGGGVRAHSSVSHARAINQPRMQPNRNVQRNVNHNINHNNPPVRHDNNININKNVNINDNRDHHHGDVDIDVDHHGWGWNDNVDIDVDHNGRGDWDIDVYHHHPAATAAIITGSVLAIGSMINSLPPNCQQVYRYGNEYYYCNNQYYQPQWDNNTVVYVVVNNP